MPNATTVDEHFAGEDPHEVVLFKLGLLRWLQEVELRSVPASEVGPRYREFDVDLVSMPTIEVNDGAWVREFRAEVAEGNDAVEWRLSDPVRRVDRTLDPTILDNTRLVECIDLTLGSSVPLPERILRYTSFLIPRQHREPFIGDLFEDAKELRADGASEHRILTVVIWQLVSAAAKQWWPFLFKLLIAKKIQDLVYRWLIS